MITHQGKETSDTKREEQTKPGFTKTDVLFGRGKMIQYHPGNCTFRRIIESYRSSYLCSKRNLKISIAKQVIHKIAQEDPPGRFMMHCRKTNRYVQVDTERSIEKVCQALREKKLNRSLINYPDAPKSIKAKNNAVSYSPCSELSLYNCYLKHSSLPSSNPGMVCAPLDIKTRNEESYNSISEVSEVKLQERKSAEHKSHQFQTSSISDVALGARVMDNVSNIEAGTSTSEKNIFCPKVPNVSNTSVALPSANLFSSSPTSNINDSREETTPSKIRVSSFVDNWLSSTDDDFKDFVDAFFMDELEGIF